MGGTWKRQLTYGFFTGPNGKGTNWWLQKELISERPQRPRTLTSVEVVLSGKEIMKHSAILDRQMRVL